MPVATLRRPSPARRHLCRRLYHHRCAGQDAPALHPRCTALINTIHVSGVCARFAAGRRGPVRIQPPASPRSAECAPSAPPSRNLPGPRSRNHSFAAGASPAELVDTYRQALADSKRESRALALLQKQELLAQAGQALPPKSPQNRSPPGKPRPPKRQPPRHRASPPQARPPAPPWLR